MATSSIGQQHRSLPKLLIAHRLQRRRFSHNDIESRQSLFPKFPQSIDETDRLPRKLRVHVHSVIFAILSGLSYLADFGTDIFLGLTQFVHCRYVEGALILIFAYLPSLFVNLIGYLWALDDLKLRPRHQVTNRLKKSVWIVGVLTQTIPALFSFECAQYCLTFRRLFITNNGVLDARMLELYYWILESDRDSTLLRVFLAFMESAPQLLIQAYVLCTHVMIFRHDASTSFYAWAHYISMVFSLFGLSWSLMIQHRSLRYVRQDKENLNCGQCFWILVWRTFTLIGRFSALLMFALTFRYWLALLLFIHYLLILVVMNFIEKPKLADSPLQQRLLLIGIGWVHLFCPWNVQEGSSCGRYFFRYLLELLEFAAIITAVLLGYRSASGSRLPYVHYIIIGAASCYVVGLTVMCLYYGCCHPNRVIRGRRPPPPLVVVYSPPERDSISGTAVLMNAEDTPVVISPHAKPEKRSGTGIGSTSYRPHHYDHDLHKSDIYSSIAVTYEAPAMEMPADIGSDHAGERQICNTGTDVGGNRDSVGTNDLGGGTSSPVCGGVFGANSGGICDSGGSISGGNATSNWGETFGTCGILDSGGGGGHDSGGGGDGGYGSGGGGGGCDSGDGGGGYDSGGGGGDNRGGGCDTGGGGTD